MPALIALALACWSAAYAEGHAAFETHCGSCRGGDGKGGEYVPDISTPGVARGRSDYGMREIIRNGLPNRGMPAVQFEEPSLSQLLAYYGSVPPASRSPLTGDARHGTWLLRKHGYDGCHVRGPGARVVGPDLAWIGALRTLDPVRQSVLEPHALIAQGYFVTEVALPGGQTVEGFIRNCSEIDLQLQGFNGSFHIFSPPEVGAVVERRGSLRPEGDLSEPDISDLAAFLNLQDGTVTLARRRDGPDSCWGLSLERILHPKPGEWPTYSGRLDGNRHSPLDQIHAGNVDRLEVG